MIGDITSALRPRCPSTHVGQFPVGGGCPCSPPHDRTRGRWPDVRRSPVAARAATGSNITVGAEPVAVSYEADGFVEFYEWPAQNNLGEALPFGDRVP
jgi:hypothetical protein